MTPLLFACSLISLCLPSCPLFIFRGQRADICCRPGGLEPDTGRAGSLQVFYGRPVHTARGSGCRRGFGAGREVEGKQRVPTLGQRGGFTGAAQVRGGEASGGAGLPEPAAPGRSSAQGPAQPAPLSSPPGDAGSWGDPELCVPDQSDPAAPLPSSVAFSSAGVWATDSELCGVKGWMGVNGDWARAQPPGAVLKWSGPCVASFMVAEQSPRECARTHSSSDPPCCIHFETCSSLWASVSPSTQC